MMYLDSTLRFTRWALAAACCLGLSTGNLFAVTFDWATVGNPGNAPDQDYGDGQFGAVDYTYRISKHEVTNDQYAEFLNNVAASDPNGLFDAGMDITQSGADGSFTYSVNAGFGPNPVNVVSFFDVMRFVNWLENAQPTGAQGPTTTEAGVYTIGTGVNETRAPGATFFIPSEDEWYKAAYYDPRSASAGGPPGDDNYWLYPTQGDTSPNNDDPPGGTNSANFGLAVGDTSDVGAYPGTTGFYGTFDQGGNLSEWNEARSMRGAGWVFGGSYLLLASGRLDFDPAGESQSVGFRVASIPEPSSLLLGALGMTGLLMRRRRAK